MLKIQREIVGNEEKNAGLSKECEVLKDDIIDLSLFDFDDQETWLLCPSPAVPHFDLQEWLKRDYSYEGCNNYMGPNNMIIEHNIIGSTINTRTFTRSKKKIGKMNFDSMKQEILSVSSSGDSNELYHKLQINWEEENDRDKDCIPAILNQSLLRISPIADDRQESLEAFLNMSQSKGIDSFINMPEPEFQESFMNISRPSVFQTTTPTTTTTTTTTTTILNDSLNETKETMIISMADSQILTESMMQTSIFNDVEEETDIYLNNTLIQSFNDNPFINNMKSNLNATDKRCFCSSKLDASNSVLIGTNNETIMSTVLFNQVAPNHSIPNQHESLIINKTFDNLSSWENKDLSYTTEMDCHKRTDSMNVENEKLNLTFDANNLSSKIQSNTTCEGPKILPFQLEKDNSIENEMSNLLLPLHKDGDEIIDPLNQLLAEECEEFASSSMKNQTILICEPSYNTQQKLHNVTFSKQDLLHSNESINNIKLPSIQNESQDDIQKDNLIVSNVMNDPLSMNRYQTYRKSAAMNQTRYLNKIVNLTDEITLTPDVQFERKRMGHLNIANRKMINCQQNSIKFDEPKFHSRLPQSFQKSNPNITSNISNKKQMEMLPKAKFAFNINEKRILRNVDGLKSYELNDVDKFQGESVKYEEGTNLIKNIESTSSVCSEIDCDDKVSIRFDNSQRLKFEGISEKDLPSPILKNCAMTARSVRSSNSTSSELKTSSPLISPTGSLQSLTANLENHITHEQERVIRSLPQEFPLKRPLNISQSLQNNYEDMKKTSGFRILTNRSASTASCIPRPASRIPAPKIIRPSKQINTQNNSKKSLL